MDKKLSRRSFVGLLSALPFVSTLKPAKLAQTSQLKVICQKWMQKGHHFVLYEGWKVNLAPAEYVGYTLHLTNADRISVADHKYAINYGHASHEGPLTQAEFKHSYLDGEPYECIVDEITYRALIDRKPCQANIIYGPPPVSA